MNSDVPHFKLMKLDIKRAYGLTFDQVNDSRLTEKHYKMLYEGLNKQQFRVEMQNKLNASVDPV